MAERQPSVSCARMESQFGINILHLPLVIHKAIYLDTGNYKLILLCFFEIKPVYIEEESFRLCSENTRSLPARETPAAGLRSHGKTHLDTPLHIL